MSRHASAGPATAVTTTTTGPRAQLTQPGFVAWLAAATVSATGDGVLYFALAWTASGLGPGAVTAVLAAGLVPEVLLTLAGGVAADRWGIRRTLLSCTLAMAALIVVLLTADLIGMPLLVATGMGLRRDPMALTGLLGVLHITASCAPW